MTKKSTQTKLAAMRQGKTKIQGRGDKSGPALNSRCPIDGTTTPRGFTHCRRTQILKRIEQLRYQNEGKSVAESCLVQDASSDNKISYTCSNSRDASSQQAASSEPHKTSKKLHQSCQINVSIGFKRD